ncbi:GntR family transcriptional regulator [Sutterella sp.]|uniref:GntR family transcriptional regulator n=1 Tax=Sutterella sp. TaxID=1981025 RepID=UPI003FD82A14
MKPLFVQTADGILEKVRRGDFTPDAPIPNEFELAALFGVSQGTVRRALKELRKRINWFVPDDPARRSGDPVVKLAFLHEEAAAGAARTLWAIQSSTIRPTPFSILICVP